jgi:hypothetical protein
VEEKKQFWANLKMDELQKPQRNNINQVREAFSQHFRLGTREKQNNKLIEHCKGKQRLSRNFAITNVSGKYTLLHVRLGPGLG